MLFKRNREYRRYNRMFTFAELLIVLAILAVLVAVVAPISLRFLEQSKESHDLQMAQKLRQAAILCVVEANIDNSIPNNTEIFVVWETSKDSSTEVAGRIYVDTENNFSTAGNSNDKLGMEFEYDLTVAIGETLGGEASEWNAERPFYYIGKAQSEASKIDDFKFSINSTTGKITYYKDESNLKSVELNIDSYVWFEEIGLIP